MKVEFAVPELEKSAVFKEDDFAIGDLALILDILRGKMYTNKIRTIVQEISSNARDAHRELGKTEPIIIKLPMSHDMTFSVQDFGPGISPDRMKNIFLLYGKSTKRNDNTQTGGFGLGAKCPFAYTDNFSITTVTPESEFNGVKNCLVKRSYTAVIDETRIGKLLRTHEEITNDRQGTTITVECKPHDAGRFAQEVANVLFFWDTIPGESRPIVKGGGGMFSWDSSAYAGYVKKDHSFYTGTGWHAQVFQYGERRRIMLVDGIPYDIRKDNIESLHDDFHQIFDMGTIILTAGIGEVQLTANREDLEYEKKTIEAIKKKLQILDKELTQQIQDRLSLAPNLWEARRTWSIIRNVASFIKKAKWGTHDLASGSSSIAFPHATVSHYSMRGGKIRGAVANYINVGKESYLYINDVPQSKQVDRSRIRTLLEANKNAEIYVVKVKEKPTWKATPDPVTGKIQDIPSWVKDTCDNIDKTVELLKEYAPLSLNAVAQTKPVRITSSGQTTTDKLPPAKLRVYKHEDEGITSYPRLWGREEDVDLDETEGTYVILSKGMAYMNEDDMNSNRAIDYPSLYQVVTNLMEKDEDFKLYGVPHRQLKNVGENMVPLDELLVAKVAELKENAEQYHGDGIGDQLVENTVEYSDDIRKLLKELKSDSILAQYFKESDEQKKYQKDYKSVNNMLKLLGLDEMNNAKKTQEFVTLTGKVYEKYPVLFHGVGYWHKNHVVKAMDDKKILLAYVRAMESLQS